MRRLWCGAVVVVAGLVFAPAALAVSAGFGLQSFAMSATERPTVEQQANHEPGSLDVQAGSHPYALTTSFVLNEGEEKGGKFLAVGGGLKDVQVVLPPGLLGNPDAVPACSYHDFLDKTCPDDTAVGEATTGLGESYGYVSKTLHRLVDEEQFYTNPVYNVEPPGGVPLELGVMVEGAHPVLLDASIRTGGDYGATVTSPDIAEAVVVASVKLTLWGVPGGPEPRSSAREMPRRGRKQSVAGRRRHTA